MIEITLDGVPRTIKTGITGVLLLQDTVKEGDVVAMRVSGEPQNLECQVPVGAVVEPITPFNEDGLNILRHSTTRVMAQVVQETFPDVDLGIDSFITGGFCYGFNTIDAVTPETLCKIEKCMRWIVKEGQRFVRRSITEAGDHEELADQLYKLELIVTKGADAEGTSVEVGAGGPTMYDNIRRDGTVVWTDLCRSPHLSSARLIGQDFALTESPSAYWKSNQFGDSLRRVYGTAWASGDDLKVYQTRLAEAVKRDHRKLGTELDPYSFPGEIGSGLVVFHPKGAMLHHQIGQYAVDCHLDYGFDFVHVLEISKGGLLHAPGHLSYYANAMFPPTLADEERGAEGNITRASQEYYLRAIDYSIHNLIFRSRGRSYRELPLCFFEMGHDYRYEKSDVVHGLTRMRSFTQDDSHAYCTPEQAGEGIRTQIGLPLSILRAFGLTGFYLELSICGGDGAKRDKFIESDVNWITAMQAPQDAYDASGLEVVPDPGGAASYGPKTSVQVKDAIGRTWQISTIQYDLSQSERFSLEYMVAGGTHQRPVMTHSVKLGNVGRFTEVFTEHYVGVFPAWLSPVRIRFIPVAETFDVYVDGVATQLRAQRIRVEVNRSDNHLGKEIRDTSKDKVPFALITGGEDAEAGAISLRSRGGQQTNGVPVREAVAYIVSVIDARINDPTGKKLHND